MNRLGLAASLKRKRPGSGGTSKVLTAEESAIYDLIKSKKDEGIWKGSIARELNIANSKVVDNCVKSLKAKEMIKEVGDVQSKARKRLMAKEFEPSKKLTGGFWYHEGSLDHVLIDTLKTLSGKALKSQKVATADGIRHVIKMSGVYNGELAIEQVKEILDNMILEKKVVKVKSTGEGEFASFPKNTDCYKLKPEKIGAFASMPCGVCPRINQCAPDGIISPATCVYYTKWLEF